MKAFLTVSLAITPDTEATSNRATVVITSNASCITSRSDLMPCSDDPSRKRESLIKNSLSPDG